MNIKNLTLLLFVMILFITMTSCDTSKQQASNLNAGFWQEFIKAFNEKKPLEINKYINSNYGFFVIDNPGAFLIVKHFYSFNEIMEMEGEFDIAYLKVLKVDCDLRDGKRPYYNCDYDENGWDKEGCFLEKSPKFKISEEYKNMIGYELVDSNIVKDEMILSKKSDSIITHLVYNTEATVGFYFGKINNRWYLLCIDKVTPCDA